ncbi:hypothetical protein [Dyadobacter sp. Leaf189]|uniref:hypothetical protein n=1 Tax=Dyadobacter sp. Leaf189 TaxID=1736295 RepID=UPI0006F9E050|nr:hypothetical protein [Dyadobacter sp. Leaf189]KQS33194.1 hypothetical protein ASG33_03665 [Dyadobacter sp. Leaf189]
MIIKFTPKYLFVFVCLGSILGISHELAHHVAGFLICGEWGYKTFNSFQLAEGCTKDHPVLAWAATLAGPVLFNYIPMWIGYFKLKNGNNREKLFGITLIFATIPIMRIVFNLMGANDESAVLRAFVGDDKLLFWLMNCCIWLITFPPLILAFRSIKNANRLAVFLFYLLAFPVFVFLFFGILMEDLIIKHHFLADTIWGMPYLVILLEILVYIGYYAFRKHLRFQM